jgi:hypothetical protein
MSLLVLHHKLQIHEINCEDIQFVVLTAVGMKAVPSRTYCCVVHRNSTDDDVKEHVKYNLRAEGKEKQETSMTYESTRSNMILSKVG